MILDDSPDNLEKDRPKIYLQLELVELVVRRYDGQDFPAARQRIVIALCTKLYAETLGKPNTHDASRTVCRTPLEIAEVNAAKGAEIKPVLRLVNHLPRQAERLSRKMGRIHLQGICHQSKYMTKI